MLYQFFPVVPNTILNTDLFRGIVLKLEFEYHNNNNACFLRDVTVGTGNPVDD